MMKKYKQITEKEAQLRLSSLCAKAEHCSGEIAEKMQNWGLEEEAKERIINQLIKEKYIDDERFTQSFVNDKITYNKWGRRKIEQALYQKRIAKDISNKILDDVPDEEYIKILHPLLTNKMKTITGRSDYERSMKLIKYAMSRGFDMNIIRECIDNAEELVND